MLCADFTPLGWETVAKDTQAGKRTPYKRQRVRDLLPNTGASSTHSLLSYRKHSPHAKLGRACVALGDWQGEPSISHRWGLRLIIFQLRTHRNARVAAVGANMITLCGRCEGQSDPR